SFANRQGAVNRGLTPPLADRSDYVARRRSLATQFVLYISLVPSVPRAKTIRCAGAGEENPCFRRSGRGSRTVVVSRETVRPYVWMLLGSMAFAAMGTLVHALGARCDWQLLALVRASLPLIFVAILARLAGVPLVFWGPGILWMRSMAG